MWYFISNCIKLQSVYNKSSIDIHFVHQFNEGGETIYINMGTLGGIW